MWQSICNTAKLQYCHTVVMMNTITTYGGGELFTLVFNGIAALFNTQNGVLIPLINVGLVVGLTYVVILMLFRNHLIEGVKWFLWVIVATNLIFLPKTKIHIHDPLTNYHRNIDNVPLALGLLSLHSWQQIPAQKAYC